MASSSDNISMAVFCDFENVALGVRDANYEKFDIKPVLERLLLKGSIVVKKAYCDWERYKGFKATMHEANFELIEIPHVRQSGKNSADIRLVVDALDLCYTKSHVNTFVIISGDSDFSPLVSKLRENAKQVIGVGVKQSTSDLLVANCDEFIFYDDLVREVNRTAAKREERKGGRQQAEKRPASSDEGNRRKEELEARKALALEMVVETFDALVSERGDSGKIWASLLKDTLKRRRPEFNESYFGFSTFGKLLEEAQSRGLLEFGRDEKSGAYVYRSSQNAAPAPAAEPTVADSQASHAVLADDSAEDAPAQPEERPRSRSSFRTPVEAQPGDASAETPPKQGRGRGRNRDRQPAEAQPVADSQPKQARQGRGRDRDRTQLEAQPLSHDNAPVIEPRGRGGRNRGGRAQNGLRSPEVSAAELAFHQQQQALEAAGVQYEEVESAPEPLTVEEAVGQTDAATPAVVPMPAPAAKERRRAPRKSAAQKAAEAAAASLPQPVEEAATLADDAAPEPVAAEPMQVAENAVDAGEPTSEGAKPARKSSARKGPARPRRAAKAASEEA